MPSAFRFREAPLQAAKIRRKRGEERKCQVHFALERHRFRQLSLEEKGERKNFREAPLHAAKFRRKSTKFISLLSAKFRRKRGKKGDFRRSTSLQNKFLI